MFGRKIEVIEETTETVSKTSRFFKELFEWVLVIVVAVVAAFVIREYLFTMVKVEGHSMDYTLAHGDKLCVVRFNYTPENGDIIVFYPFGSKERPYIKRVIATEGQSIYVDSNSGNVYVDGEVIKEDYIGSPTVSGIGFPVDANGLPTDNADDMVSYIHPSMDNPYIIPEDFVFAMGDNRSNSHDCRQIGPVNEKDIVGKAVFRWFPFSGFGLLK